MRSATQESSSDREVHTHLFPVYRIGTRDTTPSFAVRYSTAMRQQQCVDSIAAKILDNGTHATTALNVHAISWNGGSMKFDILEKLDDGDILKISKAVISVDPDAKVDTDMRENTVNVESWLYPEEFLVAFYEVGYDVRIARR